MAKLHVNSDLRSALSEYCTAFIRRLETLRLWPRPAGLPSPVVGRDYYFDEIQGMPEQELAEDIIFRHPWATEMYSHRHVPHRNTLDNPLRMLAERVAYYITLGLSPAQAFDRWYRIFLAELTNPNATIVRVHTLPRLNTNLDRITLDKRTRLENVGDWNRLIMLNFQQRDYDASFYWAYGWAIVTRRVRLKRGPLYSWSSALDFEEINRSRAAVSALRLLTDGDYEPGISVVAQRSRFPFMQMYVSGTEPLLPTLNERRIGMTEAPALSRLFKHLLETNSYDPRGRQLLLPRPISVAIQHFNAACQDRAWMEVAMELVIALEVLMGVAEEASFRLAYRTAAFIGHDDLDTLSVHRQVKALYSARSIPAHGKQPTAKDLKEFFQGMTGGVWPQTKSEFSNDGPLDEGLLIDSAVEAGRHLLRRVILACLRLQSFAPDALSWPLPKNIDAQFLTSERESVQQMAGVRKGITF